MKRRVLAITLAIVLAVLGTAGVLAYVHAADARALAGQRAVTGLVAQGKIPSGTTAGTALQSGILVSQKLPASAVPSEAVSSITPAVSGLVMDTDLQPGQVLLRPMLVTSSQLTGALAIPRGMVAVTISLCLPAAVAGYVQPGSEVAVFDTYSNSKSKTVQGNCIGSGSNQSSGGGLVLTRVVLPRVLVLSVGPAPYAGTNGTSSTSANSTASSTDPTPSTSNQVLVTLAVDQADAERLILVTEAGVSYLALLTTSSQTGFDAKVVPLFQR